MPKYKGGRRRNVVDGGLEGGNRYGIDFGRQTPTSKALRFKVFKGDIHISSSTSRESCERIAALVEGEVRP